jgi:hypothetical protein
VKTIEFQRKKWLLIMVIVAGARGTITKEWGRFRGGQTSNVTDACSGRPLFLTCADVKT